MTNDKPTSTFSAGNWADLASTGADIISGTIQNKKNREFTDQQRKAQNAFNLEQWNRANQYSSPKEQMARLAEAGLNPNLVYGSGAGQSQSANPVKASTSDGMKYEKINTGKIPTAMMMAQVQNLIANTRNTNAKTDQLQGIDLHTKEVANSKTESAISSDEQSRSESTERINKMREESRNVVQLRKNMVQQGINLETQGLILSIQADIANKEKDNFLDLDIPPNAPYWVKSYGAEAKRILERGDSLGKTVETVMADLARAWEKAKHIGRIGLGMKSNYDK